MRRDQKYVVECKPFGNLLSYHGFLEVTPWIINHVTACGYAVVPTACACARAEAKQSGRLRTQAFDGRRYSLSLSLSLSLSQNRLRDPVATTTPSGLPA